MYVSVTISTLWAPLWKLISNLCEYESNIISTRCICMLLFIGFAYFCSIHTCRPTSFKVALMVLNESMSKLTFSILQARLYWPAFSCGWGRLCVHRGFYVPRNWWFLVPRHTYFHLYLMFMEVHGTQGGSGMHLDILERQCNFVFVQLISLRLILYSNVQFRIFEVEGWCLRQKQYSFLIR